MRTLMTQMRMRRLLREHAAELERLRDRPYRRSEREVSARRLLEQVRNVREGWLAELAAARPGGPGDTVERQVVRRVVALQAAIAKLAQPGLDLERERAEFDDAAVPLLLMLRGLEGYTETILTREPSLTGTGRAA